MHLWVEACNIVVFVQNRCPRMILGMSTHEEAFTSKKPDVSHFKIFGSPVYVNVTKDARKKLESAAEIEIFVGYTETPHNYGVYFPNKKMIVGEARATLHDQGLPMHLLEEACNVAVFLQNRCHHRILDMSTPEEAFTGKKPDVSLFNIFGSSIYVHVTKDARKKLELTVEIGIFVGTLKHPIIIVCIFQTTE